MNVEDVLIYHTQIRIKRAFLKILKIFVIYLVRRYSLNVKTTNNLLQILNLPN